MLTNRFTVALSSLTLGLTLTACGPSDNEGATEAETGTTGSSETSGSESAETSSTDSSTSTGDGDGTTGDGDGDGDGDGTTGDGDGDGDGDGGQVGDLPVATINHPGDAEMRAVNTPVPMVGVGTDTEDGALTGASLVWSTDVDGQIGTGETFDWTPTQTGPVVITLRVTDSDSNEAVDAVALQIIP